MQRSALGVCIITLVLAGCAATPKSSYSRLPAPLLSTGKRIVPPARPPRPPPRLTPPRSTGLPTVRLNTRELIPPGGIKPGRWKTIVVHHSGTPDSGPQSMHEYHLRRGWSGGLGYHFVIGNGIAYPDGEVFVGPRWKRQTSGAHCKSSAGRYFGAWRGNNYFNTHGIGICLIGNFENGPPTPKQLAGLAQLIQFLCAKVGIDRSEIHGHGEVTQRTACPGKRLDMAQVRHAVNRVYAGTYR